MIKKRVDELFLEACKGLIKQGKPSVTRNKQGEALVCAYRGPRGTKCAIGQILPEEFYTKEAEGKGFRGLCGMYDNNKAFATHFGFKTLTELKEYVLNVDIDTSIFNELQKIHDDMVGGIDPKNFVEDFVYKASDLAREHKLTKSIKFLEAEEAKYASKD